MQHYKRFISLLLVIVLSMTLSVSAFAAESETPTNSELEKHTIEFVLDPESSSDDNSITPYIWGEEDYDVNNVCYTVPFTIPNPNFAYEVIGYNEYMQPCNVSFTVSLTTELNSLVSSLPVIANGSRHKQDWVSVSPNSKYKFKITNNTNIKLHIIITYYSW